MAKFICLFGHTETGPDGKLHPMVHASRTRCAIYNQLRREGKVDVLGNAVGRASPPSDTSGQGNEAKAPPPGGAGIPPGTTETAPPAAKPSLTDRLRSGLGIKYKPVTVAGPLPPGSEAQAQDWEVSPETSERFGAVIKGFIEQGCNLFTAFMEIPHVPKDVFAPDPGEAFIWRTTLRGFVTNILVKVFRAKSPEDADRIVAGLSGMLAFGMMAAKIGIHMALHLPKSPKLANFRKRREEAKAAREEKARLKALSDGKPAPAAPAPSTGRTVGATTA